MAKIAVIVLHGIGTYHGRALSFAARLRDGIASRLGPRMTDVHWRPIIWSPRSLERRQEALLEHRGTPSPWKALFQFTASGLADASSYQLPRNQGDLAGSTYQEVQNAVYRELHAVEAELGSVPVLAIAHSMGCHVLSSYAWDAVQAPIRIVPNGTDLTPFEKLETLSGLVFYGCNLPLLAMDIPNERMVPLRLPKKPLAGREFEAAWLNFWEASDVLGYPLEQEYAAYFRCEHPNDRFNGKDPGGRDPKLETAPVDRKVKRRTLRGSTPLAHSDYDRMRQVLDPIAAEIRRLLDAVA